MKSIDLSMGRQVEFLLRQDAEVRPGRDSNLVCGPPSGSEVAQFQVHFYQQETMVSPPIKLAILLLLNLYTNPQENADKVTTDSWIFGPVLKRVGEFEASVKKNPLITMGRSIHTARHGHRPKCS